MANVQILEFGPFETAGVAYVGKNEGGEIRQLWQDHVHRLCELADLGRGFFGFCRCIPGLSDGTFSYIAAMQPRAGVALDQGMERVSVPQGVYAVFGVEDLADTKDAWARASQAIAGLEHWKPYCGADGCECATHPCFEYYPPGYMGQGRFELLFPLQRK